MMDEIAISKHVECSAGKKHEYGDLGCGTIDDSSPPVRHEFVLMAAAFTKSGKSLWCISLSLAVLTSSASAVFDSMLEALRHAVDHHSLSALLKTLVWFWITGPWFSDHADFSQAAILGGS